MMYAQNLLYYSFKMIVFAILSTVMKIEIDFQRVRFENIYPICTKIYGM